MQRCNVCTRRLTHLFIREDDDILHVHGCCNLFSQRLTSLSPSVEFDEEVMKPERLTEALDNAGFKPDTRRGSKWYQKATLKGDVSHFSSSSRMSDAFVETYLTSYQVREHIEDDAERLAMKLGVWRTTTFHHFCHLI